LQASAVQLLSAVINTACVMAVVAYILARTRFSSGLMDKTLSFRSQLFLIMLCGAFTLYGATNAIPVAGGFVALGHIGQIVGGLLAGPLVGAGVGLISAGYRCTLGGFSVVPAALAALLAGVMAGLYCWWKKESRVGPAEAAVLTVLIEVIASGLSFLLIPDFNQALQLEKKARLPMIVGHALAVAVFILIIKNITEERRTREEKERIESELMVARNIQRSMVPMTFPPFPNVPEFDIYAVLEPAREVGGDLYDFFFTDEDNFCFVIGDVSGKGVPAALFMAATRTLLKAQVDKGKNIEDIIAKVNNELCRGNDASMFITMFCGILNIKTGEVFFSNGGHNPPYISRSGALEMVNGARSMALGCMEDIPYCRGSLVMEKGDTLVLYTDGVTEAMNHGKELFLEKRLELSIKRSTDSSPREVILNILEDVTGFVGGAEQSDDITILALTYRGSAPEINLTDKG